MYKKIKIITVILSIIILFMANVSNAEKFYDMEYPPNSTGFADYTEEEAIEDEKKQNEEATDSSFYVGKSSNNYLKSLSVENATMEPAFNRQYVDYTVTLQDETTKKINIIAEAEDEKATIEGAGEVELTDGKNQIMIYVKAENGNTQVYNLNIELPYKQSDIKLQDLEIYGVDIKTGKSQKHKLNPNFKNDIYEYSIDVSYNTSYLDIKAENPEGTYVSIKGGETLEIGENTITVKVIDNEDETKSTTYIIKANRAESEKNYIIYIIIAVAIVAFIIIIGLSRKKKRKKGKRAK